MKSSRIDPDHRAGPPAMARWRVTIQGEAQMSNGEQFYGIVVLATFTLFSVVLAWQSWSYAHSKRARTIQLVRTPATGAQTFGHAAH